MVLYWNPRMVAGLFLLFVGIGLLALGATGCGPSQSDANRAALDFCASHGGVASVQYYQAEEPLLEAGYSAECKDGSGIK